MMRRDHLALIAYLEDREGWTFGHAHGVRMQDCVRWASGATQVLTGRDPLAEFGGRWSTEAGAARVIRRAGGMAAAIDRVLTPIDPAQAMRGDWGLTANEAVVLFEGDGLVGLDRPSGYVRLPRHAALRAWSVG